jgi:hypothetical protein
MHVNHGLKLHSFLRNLLMSVNFSHSMSDTAHPYTDNILCYFTNNFHSERRESNVTVNFDHGM